MKYLLPVLLACCVSTANAQKVEEDKILHAGVSFVSGMVVGSFIQDNKPLAFAVAMAPGVLKEVIDIRTTGFDKRDLVADAIGAAIGVYVSGLVVSHQRKTGVTEVSYNMKF